MTWLGRLVVGEEEACEGVRELGLAVASVLGLALPEARHFVAHHVVREPHPRVSRAVPCVSLNSQRALRKGVFR